MNHLVCYLNKIYYFSKSLELSYHCAAVDYLHFCLYFINWVNSIRSTFSSPLRKVNLFTLNFIIFSYFYFREQVTAIEFISTILHLYISSGASFGPLKTTTEEVKKKNATQNNECIHTISTVYLFIFRFTCAFNFNSLLLSLPQFKQRKILSSFFLVQNCRNKTCFSKCKEGKNTLNRRYFSDLQ